MQDENVEKKPTKKAELAQKEADAVDFDKQVFYEQEGPWPILSRSAAVILGFPRYFTGEKCTYGHLSPRKTNSAGCLVCNRKRLSERRKVRMANDPEYRQRVNQKAKDRKAAKKEEEAQTI